MSLNSVPPSSSLTLLGQSSIVGWVGLEMALDGGNAMVTDETVITGFLGDSPIVWEHPAVPYCQFVSLYIHLSCGRRFRLFSDASEDCSGGLLLVGTDEEPEIVRDTPGRLFRSRVLDCLPTGIATLTVLRCSSDGAVLDAALNIGSQVVRLLSGEVHPRHDGSFKIIAPDESVLVQLNGLRPPSEA